MVSAVNFNTPTFFPTFSPELEKEDTVVRKKWNELGLDSQLFDEHPQDVAFLVKTRLIFPIVGFQNSTADGLKQNEIKIQQIPGQKQTGLWIKKEGEWTPVSQIRQDIQWDSRVNALVSQNNHQEKWNYLSNQGLVSIPTAYDARLVSSNHLHIDTEKHSKMHPVAKLSKTEMDSLLSHAQNFDALNGIITDPSSIKGALQFVTHPTTAKHSYLQNANAQNNVHCGIRLVMPDGSVHSFGLGADFHEHQLKNKANRCVTSINAQPKILDYMEFQKFEKRVVTTVPLTEDQTKEILDHLNHYRLNGVRFNILRQNCVRFGTHLLHLIGVNVNTRVSLMTTAWRCLPNVEHLPLIGTTMGSIKRSSQKVYQWTAAKIPSIVKQAFDHLSTLAFYIPNKTMVLLINLGLFAIGGKKGSSNSSLELEKTNEPGKLENFDTLIGHFLDDQSAHVYHSSIFINWQLNQKTTEVYRYSGQPQMNILPPKDSKAKLFSTQNKTKLKATYQASTEI